MLGGLPLLGAGGGGPVAGDPDDSESGGDDVGNFFYFSPAAPAAEQPTPAFPGRYEPPAVPLDPAAAAAPVGSCCLPQARVGPYPSFLCDLLPPPPG